MVEINLVFTVRDDDLHIYGIFDSKEAAEKLIHVLKLRFQESFFMSTFNLNQETDI